MMRQLLNGVRDDLRTVHTWVEVGGKPAGTPDTQPWASVWLTTSIPSGNTLTPGDIDEETNPIVHIKAVGTSFDQVAALLGRLDARIRLLTAVPGYVVQTVIRDRTAGPVRDDSTHPGSGLWMADAWFDLDLAPTP